MRLPFVPLPLIFLTLASLRVSGAESRPNVIIFLVDDLGVNDTALPMYGEPTAYNLRYRTPHLVEMAKDGVTLDNARSQALCVPSRASLMSGQNTVRSRIIGDYVPTFNKKLGLEYPGGATIDPHGALPSVLRANGYRTIHCGKYHLSEYESRKPSPEDLGFDINIGGRETGQPGSYQAADAYSDKKHTMQVPGLEAEAAAGMHLTDALTKRALEAVEKSVSEKKPFFLYFAHYAVHTPVQPHRPYYEHYDFGPKEGVAEAEYASMIEGVDNSLGTVMKKLKDLKIDDDTLVIFYSDNGGRVLWRGKKSLYGPYDFNHPARSGKASIYDGGLRVPAVVRWPGHTKAATVSHAPVMIEDLYATVCAVTHSAVPEDYKTKVDGMDFSPVIAGAPAPGSQTHRAMYFHLPYRFEGEEINGKDFADGGVTSSSCVIRDGWKLIYFHKDERFELYRISEDVSEKKNLLTAEPSKAAELVALLDKQLRDNRAIMPVRLKTKKSVRFPADAFADHPATK